MDMGTAKMFDQSKTALGQSKVALNSKIAEGVAERLAAKWAAIEALHDDNIRDDHPSFVRLAAADPDQVVR
jgi:hypothetical protein